MAKAMKDHKSPYTARRFAINNCVILPNKVVKGWLWGKE